MLLGVASVCLFISVGAPHSLNIWETLYMTRLLFDVDIFDRFDIRLEHRDGTPIGQKLV